MYFPVHDRTQPRNACLVYCIIEFLGLVILFLDGLEGLDSLVNLNLAGNMIRR